MARIEDLRDEIEQIKINRRDQPRKKSFRLRPKLTCCLLFIVFLIGLVVVILALIARTGIIQIPFFSDIFYQLPQPSRVVELTQSDLDNFEQGLNVKLEDNQVTLELSEKELTYLIRQALASSAEAVFADNVQVVIGVDGVEFFGLLLKPVKTNLTIDIVPKIADGQLVFEAGVIKVGDVAAPPFVVSWLEQNFLADELAKLNQQLKTLGQVSDLKLTDGALIISGQLDLNAL